MIAPSEIGSEAERVRREIAKDLGSGSIALAEFSRRYALTPKYKNAALAFRASIPKDRRSQDRG
jgi:hypothetical protein